MVSCPPATSILSANGETDALLWTLVSRAAADGCPAISVPVGSVVLGMETPVECLYVLLDGVLGAVRNRDGKRLTLFAFVEGEAFTCIESFMYGGPSRFGIEALTPSTYLAVSRDAVHALEREIPGLHDWLVLQLRHRIIQMTRRIIELTTKSPAERYLRFVQDRPDLVNRLPQYAIASMLGVSPESLSRIRHRLAKQGKRVAGDGRRVRLPSH